MIRRRVRRLLWVLAVCVLGLLGLRAFVCDLYRITSSSMEPLLWPGEIVAVAYDSSRPERFETVVLTQSDEYVVKRAVGIGGETGEDIMIDSSGDLQVDGARLPPNLQRERVLLFDQSHHQVGEHFARGSTAGDPWVEHEGGVLELDARKVEQGHEGGLLRYHRKLLDHHLDANGELTPGLNAVHDAAVEFDLRLLEPGGLVRVGLVEQGDTFWFVIDLAGEGARTKILRETASELSVLAEAPAELQQEAWTRITFSNIDNHVSASLGDQAALQASYEQNTLHPADHLGQGLSTGARIKLGGEGCRLEIRDLRLWRDLHYTARGEHAVGTRMYLEPGKLFFLGDNSAQSSDSREYGPVDETQVVGRPVLVIWPPSSIRWLR